MKAKTKVNRVRLQVAQEAAKIIATEGLHDFLRAKRKAADRLNVVDRRNIPTNQEIEDCLADYQSLFLGAKQQDFCEEYRKVALEAMRFFSQFSPMLTGSVLSGTANEHSDIELHLFSDEVEAVVHFLNDNDMPYDQHDRRLRAADDQWRDYPSFTFKAGEANMLLVVFSSKDRARPPLSKVDGKPVQRISRQQLETMLQTAQAS